MRHHLPCPRCGSENTRMCSEPPVPGRWGELKEKLDSLLGRRRFPLLRGRVLVTCKDCGAVSSVCIL